MPQDGHSGVEPTGTASIARHETTDDCIGPAPPVLDDRDRATEVIPCIDTSPHSNALAVLLTAVLLRGKSDPVSLDTVSTTMTGAKEGGHAGQEAEVGSSWQ